MDNIMCLFLILLVIVFIIMIFNSQKSEPFKKWWWNEDHILGLSCQMDSILPLTMYYAECLDEKSEEECKKDVQQSYNNIKKVCFP